MRQKLKMMAALRLDLSWLTPWCLFSELTRRQLTR
jgi:hypothetical protein